MVAKLARGQTVGSVIRTGADPVENPIDLKRKERARARQGDRGSEMFLSYIGQY